MSTKADIENSIPEELSLPLDGENRVLKATVSYLKNELSKFKRRPLLVCEIRKVIEDKAVIRLPNGNHFLVDVMGNLADKLVPGENVLVEQRSLTVVDRLGKSNKHDVEHFVNIEKPEISWKEIGGLKEQINEIKEVVELPLKKPELFKSVGINPPKGILLHGATGTGKTLLAKAVATSTNATFIEIVASELNQKFIGEGAKLVKDIFQLAKERAPSIIFIDEIDALAAERLDIGTSGEREVQRTFMQFLAELDGFKHLENVKVIGATNRLDVLDGALLRPGRFDRIIEVPLPDKKDRKEIFKIHSKNMNLENIDFEILAEKCEEFSGAEIYSVCTEAGYFAIRNNRTKVNEDDFFKAVEKVRGEESKEHMEMFR